MASNRVEKKQVAVVRPIVWKDKRNRLIAMVANSVYKQQETVDCYSYCCVEKKKIG